MINELLPEKLRIGKESAMQFLHESNRLGCVGVLFFRHREFVEEHRSYFDPPPWWKPGAAVGAYGMGYVLEGRATLRYFDEETSQELIPGTVFFVKNVKGVPNYQLEPEDGFLECSVFIDAETARDLESLNLLKPDLPPAEIGLRRSLIQSYLNLYEGVCDLAVSPDQVFRRSIALFDEIYTLADPLKNEETFALRAKRLLSENPQPTFSMQEAATFLHLPYHYFRQRFKAECGVAPGEYQLRERMVRAKQLLASHSVKETAYVLGYKDPYFFSRQFKKVVGCPPKTYRNEARERGEV